MPIMSLFGPHIDPPLALIPHILGHTGATVFQTTLRDPRRLSKDGVPDPDDREAYIKGAAEMGGLWGIAHASMLTSLGSPNPMTRNASAGALVADANLSAEIGLAGVCFHVGYAKGHDSTDAAIDAVIYKLTDVISRLKPGARVLLENGAEGTELGQTIAEVGKVARGVGAGTDKLGFVMDTCHLHVAGFDMADPGAPEMLADQITSESLAPYLTCLHLNDAKFPCGSKRDRHAPPGEGTIGEGLLRLLAHPMFRELPCILEISQEDAIRGIAFLEQKV
jgi:deoxyribonuclease-4